MPTLKSLNKISLFFLIATIICFTAFRAWLLLDFGDNYFKRAYTTELFDAFITGLRFDIKVIAIFILPAYIVYAIRYLPLKRPIIILSENLLINYYSALFFVLILASFINHYYFSYFQTTIDPRIFALLEDNTTAIFMSVLDDYPFFLLTTLCVLLTISLHWILKLTIRKRHASENSYKKHALETVKLICIVIILAIASRGSVTTFPLGQRNLSLSTVPFINNLVPNGLIALHYAVLHYRTQSKPAPMKTILRRYGITDVNEAYLAYTGNIRTITSARDLSETIHSQPATNHKNPSHTLPNIVISLQESMSYHGLYMLSQQPELLGELRQHLEQDYYFQRVLSANDSTDETLDNLLFRSPLSPLSQSEIRHYRIAGNALTPFKQAGYRIIFAHGGNNGWRNMHRFLPAQGFDLLIGEPNITNYYPDASYDGAWGVYDEYLFRYVEKLLAEATQPTIIVVLTTSNHSPYKLPDFYTPKIIDLEKFKDVDFIYDADKSQLIMQSFIYANDALAQFISHIKNSAQLKDNTIIVFTGDHNFRNVAKYTDHKYTFLKRAVPLYFYLPEWLRNNLYFDPFQPSAHHDIFPTLYGLALQPHLILRNIEHLPFGRNLFSKNSFAKHWGMFADSLLITEDGVLTIGENPLLFPWDNHGPYTKTPINLMADMDAYKQIEQANAYQVLLHWVLKESIPHKQ